MICNSSSWGRSSGETEEEEEVGSQRGRGEVLLGIKVIKVITKLLLFLVIYKIT